MELYDLQKFPVSAGQRSFEEVMILEKRGLKQTSFGRNPISEMSVFYLFVFANCNCLGKMEINYHFAPCFINCRFKLWSMCYGKNTLKSLAGANFPN